MWGSKKFLLALFGFISVNILLYLYIAFFHGRVPFHEINYTLNSHHYFEDPRIKGGEFEFLRALGQYDAQWYLKIASEGYSKKPANVDIEDKTAMDGLTYAFFPLYPVSISILNFFVGNIELTAFIFTNLLLIANFISLYYVIIKLYSETIALKTIFLLYLFPFSIFYRSYFTEGLFLLLLVWFTYFLIKKKWLYTTIALSLLLVTRPTGLFLTPIFSFFLYQEIRKDRVLWQKAFGYLAITAVPILGWLIYNSIQTGNPLYWYSVQSAWYNFKDITFPLIENLKTVLMFRDLYPHSFHSSRIDVLVILVVFVLSIASRKKLNPSLWWTGFALWFFPLLLKDTMSFSRYQIVSFPLFLYLATVLKNEYFITALGLFAAGLFWASLYFVNWWWVG